MAEGKIYAAIAKAMQEVGAVTKSNKNQQQGFLYRSVDAVYNAINPALIKAGVFCVPEVLERSREDRQTKSGGNLTYSIVRVRYTFYADDGSSVSAVIDGEGMDSADKSTNKAMAAAFKYAMFQTFCIPTEELQDPDADTHSVAPVKKQEQKKQEQKPAEQKKDEVKYNADMIRRLLKESGVSEDFVLKLYNKPSLEVMSSTAIGNVIEHIDDIIKKQKEAEG